MDSDNRRKDFRIDITLYFRWKALTVEETELLRRGMGSTLLKRKEVPSPIDEILKQTAPGSREEQLYRSLQLINNKLDFIIDNTFLESTEPQRHQDKITELSGSGLKFLTHEKLSLGTFIKMNIIMPGTFQYQVELIVEVLRVEQRGNMSEVAAQIEEIDDTAKDAIIKIVFQKQRQEIRREKQLQGGQIDD